VQEPSLVQERCPKRQNFVQPSQIIRAAGPGWTAERSAFRHVCHPLPLPFRAALPTLINPFLASF